MLRALETDSSDEEDCQLPFWNNWLPSSDLHGHEKFICNSLEFTSINLFAKNSERSNWIHPAKFLNTGIKRKAKPVQVGNVHHEIFEKSKIGKIIDESYHEGDKSTVKWKTIPMRRNSFICSQDEKFDWRGRTQLHDVTKFSDGDLIWGVVNLGVFARIKLWINDYGNICASADGTISKPGSTETTFISLTNAELLRKILGLSGVQWASLCETVKEAKCALKFDAFEDFKLMGKTGLEKLWFLMCKRRHFLPDQIMLVKLNGAVKCLKKFNIVPKVIVQEIRYTPEQSIF